MKEFGEFSECVTDFRLAGVRLMYPRRFYGSSVFKSRIRHLLFASSNKASLSDFREKIDGFRAQLSHLLSQQAVLILANHTRMLDSIERKLTPFSRFYSSLTTDDELSAETFVAENGGEENVQTVRVPLHPFIYILLSVQRMTTCSTSSCNASANRFHPGSRRSSKSPLRTLIAKASEYQTCSVQS